MNAGMLIEWVKVHKEFIRIRKNGFNTVFLQGSRALCEYLTLLLFKKVESKAGAAGTPGSFSWPSAPQRLYMQASPREAGRGRPPRGRNQASQAPGRRAAGEAPARECVAPAQCVALLV